MLSAEAIADVVELLQTEDFYRSANGRIFEVLRELYARGDPVDQLSAVEALRRKGTLDDVGGPLYIRDLADQVPTPASAAHYARIVAQAALLRRLIGAAADVMDMAYSAPEEPEGGRGRRGATDLRRRAPGRSGRGRDAARADRRRDARARADPASRGGLHGPAHRVPRPRRAHLRSPARQPRDHRRPARDREVFPRHQHRAQRRRRWRIGRGVLPRDVPARGGHADAVLGRAGALGPDPQQARRAGRLGPGGPGGRATARRPALHRGLRQRQHRRRPRQGPPDAEQQAGSRRSSSWTTCS